MRQRNLKKLRAGNYDGSEADWRNVLLYSLVSKQQANISEEQKGNLEVSCSISGRDPNRILTISFRRRVQDITQRLGTIELPQTSDDSDIDLFGWALQAVGQRDTLSDEVAAAQQKLATANETIAVFQGQLADLVKAKTEHEQQLLAKFTLLLNEKKLYIRNQQRALQTGQVDKKSLDQLRSTLSGREAKSTINRGHKRRAAQEAEADQGDESDGFEAMDVDSPNAEPDDGSLKSSSRSTTPSTDTASEAEGDLDVTANLRSAGAVSKERRQRSPSPLPPPRVLPFQKTGRLGKPAVEEEKKKTSPAKVPLAMEDEETASEEDEL